MKEEVVQSKEQKIEALERAIKTLKENKHKIVFYVPDVGEVASAAVYEIYHQHNVLKKNGFETYLLTDNPSYKIPDWLDTDLHNINLVTIGKDDIIMNPEDVIVIPEYYSQIAYELKRESKFSALKVVLLQSVDLMLKGLPNGGNFADFGFDTIITTHKPLKDFFESTSPLKKYEIKTYNPLIPEYFAPPKKEKKLFVSFLSRNRDDITKVVKLFYQQYPQYRWITFEDLSGTTREAFAEKMKHSFCTVWIDKIASFGTTPLEAMACGNVVIGYIPDVLPEYVTDESGLWSKNILDFPKYIANAIEYFIGDGKDISENYKPLLAPYTRKESEKSILNIYKELAKERLDFFNKTIISIKK